MHRSMKRAAIVALGLGCAALAPRAATAQIAGNYDGTSADGQSVHFVVDTDPDTGNLAITSATVFFSAPCKGVAVTENTGWGFGLMADIVNRQVTSTTNGDYFSIAFKLGFSANGQAASGQISSISPKLYSPTGGRPTKALYCVSPAQTMSLTYTPPAAATAAIAGKAPTFNVAVPAQ